VDADNQAILLANARSMRTGSAPIARAMTMNFDDVEPALPALVLGHERLMLAEALGELLLGQVGLVARRDQQLA